MGVLKSHGRQGPPPCPAAIEAGPLPPQLSRPGGDLVPHACRPAGAGAGGRVSPPAWLALVVAAGWALALLTAARQALEVEVEVATG